MSVNPVEKPNMKRSTKMCTIQNDSYWIVDRSSSSSGVRTEAEHALQQNSTSDARNQDDRDLLSAACMVRTGLSDTPSSGRQHGQAYTDQAALPQG